MLIYIIPFLGDCNNKFSVLKRSGADGIETCEAASKTCIRQQKGHAKMKPKKLLKTVRFIEGLRKKAKRKQTLALHESDPKDRAKYECDANGLQNEADQMQAEYYHTVNTADRKL